MLFTSNSVAEGTQKRAVTSPLFFWRLTCKVWRDFFLVCKISNRSRKKVVIIGFGVVFWHSSTYTTSSIYAGSIEFSDSSWSMYVSEISSHYACFIPTKSVATYFLNMIDFSLFLSPVKQLLFLGLFAWFCSGLAWARGFNATFLLWIDWSRS